MGFLENTGSTQIKYVYLFDGKICLRTSENDQQARRRVNKEGKAIYERCYPGLEGTIRDIFIRHPQEAKYGKQLCVFLEDDGEFFQLNLSFNSKQARILLYRLPELDLKHKMQITTFIGDDNYTAFAVWQHETRVLSHYTREKPNGLPDLKEVMVSGERKYDATERNDFLRRMIRDSIHPQLGVDTLDRERNQIIQYDVPGTETPSATDEDQEFIPPSTKAQNSYPDYYDQSGEDFEV